MQASRRHEPDRGAQRPPEVGIKGLPFGELVDAGQGRLRHGDSSVPVTLTTSRVLHQRIPSQLHWLTTGLIERRWSCQCIEHKGESNQANARSKKQPKGFRQFRALLVHPDRKNGGANEDGNRNANKTGDPVLAGIKKEITVRRRLEEECKGHTVKCQFVRQRRRRRGVFRRRRARGSGRRRVRAGAQRI